MKLEFDATAAEQLLEEYPKRVERVAVRALNRGIMSGRTLGTQTIAREMRLKSSLVRARLRVQEATPSTLWARLSASARPVRAIHFGARGPMPSRGRGGGVTLRLPGGNVTKPDAFMATMPGTGVVGVFERATDLARKSKGAWSKNLPIKQVPGPSVGDFFVKHRAAIIARMREIFETNLRSGLKFAKRDD